MLFSSKLGVMTVFPNLELGNFELNILKNDYRNGKG